MHKTRVGSKGQNLLSAPVYLFSMIGKYVVIGKGVAAFRTAMLITLRSHLAIVLFMSNEATRGSTDCSTPLARKLPTFFLVSRFVFFPIGLEKKSFLTVLAYMFVILLVFGVTSVRRPLMLSEPVLMGGEMVAGRHGTAHCWR